MIFHLIAALMIIIVAAAFVVNVLKLAEVGSMRSYNHPLDITACVILPLIAACAAVFVWGSGYTFGKNALFVNIGFAVKKIPYDRILKLRSDEKRSALALYYALTVTENGAPAVRGEMIRINPELFDEFAKTATSLAKKAEYEIVGEEEE